VQQASGSTADCEGRERRCLASSLTSPTCDHAHSATSELRDIVKAAAFLLPLLLQELNEALGVTLESISTYSK